MSDPSTPIFVPSRSSTPSPTPAPARASSSTPDPNDMMNHLIQQHRRRGHATRGRMATTPITQEQVRRNAMEDAREYHEECSDNLTDDYQRGFRIATGHGAMIGHWSSMFTTPISEVLTAFASTPSITFPALLNLPPPPLPALADIPAVHDWEIGSQTSTPPLPIPPPLPH